jgi:acetyl-CoA carboxylase biotin carboxyl carrier protein
MAGRRRAGESAGPESGADARVVALTRRLGAVLAELGLSEIEVESRELRVRVQRAAAATPAVGGPAGAAVAPPVAAAAERAVAEAAAGLVTVEAPMVGTFYRAPSPTSGPFVREGDLVKEGQVLCIIEAMKLMNEIESRTAGRIARILVENGQPVEYGQPLFLIDPQR